MVVLKYSGATVRAVDLDGLVVAHVHGVVAETQAKGIIADARKWAAEPMAQVVIYRDARVQLDADDLFRAATAAKAGSTATALVVPVDQYAMFQKYVQMHVSRGVLKAVFTEDEAAHRWAAHQASVQGYWQRLMKSRQSSP